MPSPAFFFAMTQAATPAVTLPTMHSDDILQRPPPESSTAFWNTNMPPHLHMQNCPSFLQYAFGHDKDRDMLSTKDSEYHRTTWPEVKQIIGDNRLDLFLRVPSGLRRYREYCVELIEQYGSVMAFVMQERVKWEDVRPKGGPFEYAGMNLTYH